MSHLKIESNFIQSTATFHIFLVGGGIKVKSAIVQRDQICITYSLRFQILTEGIHQVYTLYRLHGQSETVNYLSQV